MGNVIQEEVERARQAHRDHLEAEREKTLKSHRDTAAFREEYENSEQGQVAREHAESERIMRLPTPEALKALGSVVPEDPTRFPSE